MKEPTTDPAFSEDDALETERAVAKEIEKSQFDEKLDKAIEERRLTDVVTELYEFDAQQFEFEIDVQGVKYKHRFRAPTQTDEMRKEAMSVTIRRNAGTFQGDPMIESLTDNANALRRFYDACATHVWGYPINEDEEAEQWLSVTHVVEPVPDGAPEGTKEKTLLDFIPDADKIKAASRIHGSSTHVISEKGKRIRSVKSRREYVVKQLFGVERDDDGQITLPKNVTAYHFDEGSAKHISEFDRCLSSKTLIKKGGEPEERRTISIVESTRLFDKLINYIQGGSIAGEEVRKIEHGDKRLEQIPDRCKVDAIFVYMNFLKS